MYNRHFFTSIFFALLLCSFAIPPELIHQFTLKMQSGFGQKNSPVEVYIFSDWQSNGKDQALIAAIANQSVEKARVYFVDKSSLDNQIISHKNLDLLLNGSKDLQSYLKAREALLKAAKNPNLLNQNEISVSNEADIAIAEEMFQSMFKNLHIEQTPAVLVINLRDGKQLQFSDPKSLTVQGVSEAISTLK